MGGGNDVKLKEWFPEAFEPRYQVGKWYISKENQKIFFCESLDENQEVLGYGISADGYWLKSCGIAWTRKECTRERVATREEVLIALEKEAIERGYKKYDYVTELCAKSDNVIQGSPQYCLDGKFQLWYGGVVLFKDGQWAEIIPTITKQEAEKLLNKKIV